MNYNFTEEQLMMLMMEAIDEVREEDFTKKPEIAEYLQNEVSDELRSVMENVINGLVQAALMNTRNSIEEKYQKN